MENTPLSRINLYDKVNATVLGWVTSEMPKLNQLRAKNAYSDSPTMPDLVDMQLKVVQIDGVKIRYSRVENPGKPKLVLLSPFPQSIVGFATIWTALTQRYDVLAYDLPGFGMSEGGVPFMNFKAQGDFLPKVLDHFELKDVHLLGPDVGMPTALYYVAVHEHRVKSVMIGDGPGIAPSSNASVIRKMVDSAFWRMVFRVAGSGALIEAGTRICNVRYTPNVYELSDYKRSYQGRVATVLEWFRGYPESLAVLDPLLHQVSVPALIFWGSDDAILYVDNGERLHERLPNSRLKVFEDCGHFAYQDCHEEFVGMVESWIEEHEG
ncbi:alpha/beta fold hydrolase [Rubritalea marina]|uniref:alpha/beta fold hydrolase n=1 Tax=Rubritalea marina TaxID=361055 RepID=UPI000369A91F|nr:alpha/beta hydrolase [Rubritalea marina]